MWERETAMEAVGEEVGVVWERETVLEAVGEEGVVWERETAMEAVGEGVGVMWERETAMGEEVGILHLEKKPVLRTGREGHPFAISTD